MRTKPIAFAFAAMLATAAMGVTRAADEQLVTRHSRVLDEVRTAPATASYRKVNVAPIDVSFRKGWPRDANKIQSRHESPEEDSRLAQDMAQGLRNALEGALRDRGYDLVGAPGPGVLVLRARIADLQVNATERGTVPYTQTFVREAGEATLHLEGFDGASGARVLVVKDHAKARFGMRGAERATDVSNRFWFDEMFQRWAGGIAGEVVASR
jgi:Protein of unknown function (DUF3313)